MKKLLGILAIMFSFIMTSFSQNHVNETEFLMTLDGVSTTNFTITHNLLDPNSPGTLLILFNDNMIDVYLENDDIFDMMDVEVYYKQPNDKIGIYMLRIDFNHMNPGLVNIIGISETREIVYYTKQDIINSFNSGVASINTDSIYLAGINSIDTTMYINKGINSVVIPECNLDAAYLEGQMSVNTDSVDVFYDIGFADGQVKSAQTTTNMKSATADIGLSAYPNPVDNGTDVYVSCFDFLKVDVYNLSGTKMFTTESQYVSTINLTEGIYVFVVWDRNNNTDITKIIVK